MTVRTLEIVALFVTPLIVPSCASVQPPRDPAAAVAAPEAMQPPSSQGSTTGSTASGTPSPLAAPAGKPGAEGSDLVRKGEILVTKQIYQQTFDDARILIGELNAIIAREDYSAWLTYLTSAYRGWYSDPSNLAAISEQPMLRRQGVVLHTIKDYFDFVVVPSRANARLDDLDFVDPDHVKAIMIVNGKRYILYDLRRQGREWKIGVSS